MCYHIESLSVLHNTKTNHLYSDMGYIDLATKSQFLDSSSFRKIEIVADAALYFGRAVIAPHSIYQALLDTRLYKITPFIKPFSLSEMPDTYSTLATTACT